MAEDESAALLNAPLRDTTLFGDSVHDSRVWKEGRKEGDEVEGPSGKGGGDLKGIDVQDSEMGERLGNEDEIVRGRDAREERKEPSGVKEAEDAEVTDGGEERDEGSGGDTEEEEDDTEERVAFEVSEASRRAKELQEQAIAELQLKRRARALAVPTNDEEVRKRLRAVGEPITLFGEKEMERRERLRDILVRLDGGGQLDALLAAADEGADAEAVTETATDSGTAELFYTEGSQALLAARHEIASFSLPRAAARLRRAKRLREESEASEEIETQALLGAVVGKLSMECSEIGDERPLSGCAFSSDASLLATSGWSGQARVWSLPRVKGFALLKGHTERVTSVAFHPFSCTPSLSPSSANLATASADRTALLWALPDTQQDTGAVRQAEMAEVGEQQQQGEEGRAAPPTTDQSTCTPLRKLSGHLDRLARIAFHPSGRFIGTTSFDKTWRLWDVETGVELLLQEGHSRAVYGIGFQCDGSLVATCGLDALCHVWDLRSGRSIMALEAHVKPLLCCEFAPNGHVLATAGEDHSCRIWDLRKRSAKRSCLYTIPAHNALVSQVRWKPVTGAFLLTAGYDNATKIWSGSDFKPVRMLAGHEGKVMGADVSAEGHNIVTVSYDRTIRLWSQGSL